MKPSPSADCLFLCESEEVSMLRSLVLTDLDSTLPLVLISGWGIEVIELPPAVSPGAVQTGEEQEIEG
jgi:hypothetical protein